MRSIAFVIGNQPVNIFLRDAEGYNWGGLNKKCLVKFYWGKYLSSGGIGCSLGQGVPFLSRVLVH